MRKFDQDMRLQYGSLLAGTDEAGRGPLAGPVVAAAVMFDPSVDIPGVADSKTLKEYQREQLFAEICEKCVSYSITVTGVEVIEKINILASSLSAMKISSEKIIPFPAVVLVDGNRGFQFPGKVVPVIKGDSKSMSIAAASILAKVTRDRIMLSMHELYPVYGWDHNKGYPTKAHFKAIRENGITVFHRKSFLKKFFTMQGELDFGVPDAE